MLSTNLLKSSHLMPEPSLVQNFFAKSGLNEDAAYEFQKEELNPFSSGEWLKLESAEEKLGLLEVNKLSPSKEKITSRIALDDDESKEEEKEDRVGLRETEENRRILKGPHWNYPLRKMSLDNEYYGYVLFGVQRQFLTTPEDRILKGEQWVAKKPITSPMAGFILKRLKKMNPGQTALVELETGRTLTYGEFVAKAESLACGLHWLGLQPKQVVSIVSFNSLEAHLMVLACLLLGAIVAFVDSSLNPAELSIILRITSPNLVFTEVGKTQYKVEIAISYLSCSPLFQKPQLIINSTTLPESSNYFLFQQLLKEVNPKEKTPGPRRADPHRPIMIIFTGNQENTKGCLLSEQYFTNSKAFVDTVLPPCDDSNFTVMVTSPMYCNTAIKTIINNLIDGHRIIICRGQIPEPCLITALRRFEVFAMLTVRTTLMNLLYWPAKPRCPHLKLLAVSGLPLRRKNLLKVHNDVFNKKVQIMQLYDLVETGPVATNTFLVSKIGSVGKPFYNVEMKVLDMGTDMVLEPNQEGELCVKSPTMAIGYYNSINAIVDNLVTDHEGFIHTGDLGYYDDEGFVYVIDKICDMIKWRTYIVSPSLVESVLMEQPEVKEALVLGVFHEEDGELVTAAVIFEFGYEQTNVADFEKKVNLLLPHHRKIRGGVYIFQQFPRSSIGKPLKGPILKEVLERKMMEC